MAIKNRTELKEYFRGGKRPTELQFADLIDSLALKSEVTSDSLKPYKIFSALLSVINDSLDPLRPHYVISYTLLETNTIGEINLSISSNYLTIDSYPGSGLFAINRRFISLGLNRMDFNYSSVVESDDYFDDSIYLFFELNPQETHVIFNNLPIEIRVYDEMEDNTLPGGSFPNPSNPIFPSNPEVKS